MAFAIFYMVFNACFLTICHISFFSVAFPHLFRAWKGDLGLRGREHRHLGEGTVAVLFSLRCWKLEPVGTGNWTICEIVVWMLGFFELFVNIFF